MTPEDIARRAREFTETPAQMVERISALIPSCPRELATDAPPADKRKRWREIRAHDGELAALRIRVAAEFGKARGWKPTRRQFDVNALSGRRETFQGRALRTDWPHRFTDHRFHYIADRRPVALVGHPYDIGPDRPGGVVEWAEAHGLKVTFPDFPSWHFPGRTSLVLFERA